MYALLNIFFLYLFFCHAKSLSVDACSQMSSNLLCRTVFWYSLITCACHLLLSVTKTLFPLHRAILFVNKLIYATAKRDNKKTGKSDNWKFKRNDRKTVHMRCRLIEWYQFYYSFLYVCLTLRFSSFSSTSYCCLYSVGSVFFSLSRF